MVYKLILLIVLLVGCNVEDYYQSDYYQENEFFGACLKEGRTQTECDLAYQEKKTLKAQEDAANRAGYDY